MATPHLCTLRKNNLLEVIVTHRNAYGSIIMDNEDVRKDDMEDILVNGKKHTNI